MGHQGSPNVNFRHYTHYTQVDQDSRGSPHFCVILDHVSE